MKKIILLLSLLGLIAAGCNSNQMQSNSQEQIQNKTGRNVQNKDNQTTTAWKTYRNAKFNISFDYPSSFKIVNETDYSNIGAVNPGLAVSLLGSDNKTTLFFQTQKDNFLNQTADQRIEDSYQTEVKFIKDPNLFVVKPVGTFFASKINLGSETFVKYGVPGDYSYETFDSQNSYAFSLTNPEIYDQTGFKVTGYQSGVLSDSDFQKVVQSLKF